MWPLADTAPIVALPPEHIVWLDPAWFARAVPTVITTLFEWVQPVAVIFSVNVYVVVTVGLTVGRDEVDVNPLGLDTQLYVLPLTDAAPIDVLLPEQIL